MSNPRNYSLRSHQPDAIIEQPQSPARHPDTPRPKSPSSHLVSEDQPPVHQLPIEDSEEQEIGIMNSHIQLDSFKGQGEDPAKWFSYFEKYAMFNNLKDERAALAMPFHLKGIAKTWYDSLSGHTQQSMNLLKAAFLNRFKTTNNVDISVLTISQKQEESAEEYFSRFIESSHSREIPEQLQISILMKGLKPSLLTLVMPKNPGTLEDMRQAMVLAEQTTNASAAKAVNSIDSSLQKEIQCLRNQLSEVLALQSSKENISSPQTYAEPRRGPQSYPSPCPPTKLPENTYPHNYNDWHHPAYSGAQPPRQHWSNRPPVGRQTFENRSFQNRNSYQSRPQYQAQHMGWKCEYCGSHRYHIRDRCPASGQKCYKCGKIGHFKYECTGGIRSNSR